MEVASLQSCAVLTLIRTFYNDVNSLQAKKVLHQLQSNSSFNSLCELVMCQLVDSFPSSLTDQLMLSLLKPSAKVLNLKRCGNVSLYGLQEALKRCPKVKQLNISECNQLAHPLIATVLSNSASQLEYLICESCDNLKDDAVKAILRKCQNLKHLGLASNEELTDDIFQFDNSVTSNSASETSINQASNVDSLSLTSIDLSGCLGVSSTAVRYLTMMCGPNLRSVNLSWTNMDCSALLYLAGYSLSSAVHLATFGLNVDMPFTVKELEAAQMLEFQCMHWDSGDSEYMDHLIEDDGLIAENVSDNDSQSGDAVPVQLHESLSLNSADGDMGNQNVSNNPCFININNNSIVPTSIHYSEYDKTPNSELLARHFDAVSERQNDSENSFGRLQSESIQRENDVTGDQNRLHNVRCIDENRNSVRSTPICICQESSTDHSSSDDIHVNRDDVNDDSGFHPQQSDGSEELAKIRGDSAESSSELSTDGPLFTRSMDVDPTPAFIQKQDDSTNQIDFFSDSMKSGGQLVMTEERTLAQTVSTNVFLSQEDLVQDISKSCCYKGILGECQGREMGQVVADSQNEDTQSAVCTSCSPTSDIVLREQMKLKVCKNCHSDRMKHHSSGHPETPLKTVVFSTYGTGKQSEGRSCSGCSETSANSDLNTDHSENITLDKDQSYLTAAVELKLAEKSGNSIINSDHSENLDKAEELIHDNNDSSMTVESDTRFEEVSVNLPLTGNKSENLSQDTRGSYPGGGSDSELILAGNVTDATTSCSNVDEDSSAITTVSATQRNGTTPDRNPVPAYKPLQLFTASIIELDVSEIDFYDKDMGIGCLKMFVDVNRTLKVLSISWKSLDDSLLEYIAKHEPDLQRISLVDCEGLTNYGIISLAVYCTKLTTVDLKGVPFVNDIGLVKLICKEENQLKSLSLAECAVMDLTLRRIAEYCANSLTHLDLSWGENFSDVSLSHVIKCCRYLEIVDLRQCEASSETITTLTNYGQNLVSLGICSVKGLTDQMAAPMLWNLCSLEHVDLSWNSFLTDETVTSLLLHCPRLKTALLAGLKRITSRPFLLIVSGLAKWQRRRETIRTKLEKEFSVTGKSRDLSAKEVNQVFALNQESTKPGMRILQWVWSDDIPLLVYF